MDLHGYLSKVINYLLAAVWLVNGLLCKLLNLVPRHQLIVAKILGTKYGSLLTMTIGFLEVLMAIWILSGIRRQLNATVQIVIIAAMNIIEFVLAPELLLFGRTNLLLAIILTGIVYYNGFILNKVTSA